MICPNFTTEVEPIFIRSCLESAPVGRRPVRITVRMASKRPASARLHELKQQLLHAALEQATHPQLRKQLCGAANTAAELAWETDAPLLVFPCLFEEMARPIQQRFLQEEHWAAGNAAAMAVEWEESEPVNVALTLSAQ